MNTGWTGGPHGVGHRMKIGHTRAMVHAALDGSLRDVPTVADPVFGLHVPATCPNVPSEVLNPRNTWEDKDAYDRAAANLARMFGENFKDYEAYVDDDVKAVNPGA